MKVIVIGGGPAGILASYKASKEGNQVVLLEKNNIIGKKILVTGKGRCNFTSSVPMSEFISNVPGNGKFLFSAFENFTNEDIIHLLEENGVKGKEERGNRMFPTTDRAEDVRKAFENLLRKAKVDVRLGETVTKIKTIDLESNIKENEALGKKKYQEKKAVEVITNKNSYKADKIILATGGMSYPGTGSTGDGYRLAKELGHSITDIRGSLVPLEADASLCPNMQGLSLRNVGVKIIDKQINKTIYEDFGEMLFTHFGVSGPTILSASSHLIRYKDIDEKIKKGEIYLKIDLKPALSEEQLDARLIRDFEEFKNKRFKNSLEKLLPGKMIETIVEVSKIDPEKQSNSITKEERQGLVKLLKNFEIRIDGFRPVEEAIVTAGGISIKEIDPKSMESKLVKNLYFAGEIIDVDAYTGGFNLQIAYSTGYSAGTDKEN